MNMQNLAVKLCGILQSASIEEITAREWRLIGQEQDGSQILTWVTKINSKEVLNIGIYTNKTKILSTLYTFEEKFNIIQASVNSSHSLLVYVVKTLPSNEEKIQEPLYCPYLLPLLLEKDIKPIQIEDASLKQIMVQYIYGKTHKYSPGLRNDCFLLFNHLECIKIYKTPMMSKDLDDGTEDWEFDGIIPDPNIIVKVFSWAQWDCLNQVLYYIHYRQPTQSFAEGEEVKSPSEITPTLSALQFHADSPHETVLNIPLNLPHVGGAGGAACGEYEDDVIPLRVHDCSLDLQIVSDPAGLLCICHHYLYKPLDDSTSSLVLEDSTELKETGVNFAYSITVLHHGCVVHSVVPDLPWALAKSLRPSYTLYEDQHLLVNIPMLFTHLLDVSLSHEPLCHVVLPNEESEASPSLAPVVGWGPNVMVDLNTLDIVTLTVNAKDMAATFKSNTALENKLSIMHYMIHHEGNLELAEELISWMCLNQRDGFGSLQQVMQEYLIGTTFAVTKRTLPSSAVGLMNMLPFTQHNKFSEVKIRETTVAVSQEKLWNVSVVVLAARQRVNQFAEDMWTRLWSALNPRRETNRFEPTKVIEKLRVSLHCYQPEALSRCSTPRSPTAGGGGGGGCGGSFAAAAAAQRRSSISGQDLLPFFEVDECTASKQEHIIAANLREVSVHLMRATSEAGGGGGGGGSFLGSANKSAVESGVHAVATRWTAAQLDASRALCRAVCKAAAAIPLNNQQRGFTFIDDLAPTHALILFKLLEQYSLSCALLAFPVPCGFTSFYTYLGYRVLPFHTFTQYIHRSVLELQYDVIKAIMADRDDSPESVRNKLRLIQLAGEGRARRALGAWGHRAALVLRARHHAAVLLSGGAQPPLRRHEHAHTHPPTGISAMPSGERLSPLDTFLDLLTAKASLNELDFNLIIEATLASMQGDIFV